MTTKVQDFKTVAQLITGKKLSNAKMLRNADRMIGADPFSQLSMGTSSFADPENPTNEEKAEFCLNALASWFIKVASDFERQQQAKIDRDNSDIAANKAKVDME